MNKDYIQGDRPDARNILVVLTSGRLGDEVEKPIEVSYDGNIFAELLIFGILYPRFPTSCNFFRTSQNLFVFTVLYPTLYKLISLGSVLLFIERWRSE